MAEFKRKIDKKIADEIARLEEIGEPMEDPGLRELVRYELALYKHLKKWNEDNY